MRAYPPPTETPEANKAAANLIAELTKSSTDAESIGAFVKRVVDNRDRDYQEQRRHFIARMDRLNQIAQAMLAIMRGDDRSPMDDLVDQFVEEVDEELRHLL